MFRLLTSHQNSLLNLLDPDPLLALDFFFLPPFLRAFIFSRVVPYGDGNWRFTALNVIVQDSLLKGSCL